MKQFIKKILIFLLPLRNIILLESVPNLSDNTKAVFDELIRRGINNKYKIIWILNNPETNPPQIENVSYIMHDSFLLKIYRIVSKCMICCNDFLVTVKKGQTSFYLSHGTPIKSLHDYYTIPNEIDYCLAAGPDIMPICSYEFCYPQDKFFTLGFPRNDVLTKTNLDLKKIFEKENIEKFIVWYPTYRQHKNGFTVTANALPILNDSEKAKQLNDVAKLNKTLIILKPHFAQDISYIKDLNLSNIIFINDKFFEEKNITSYEFVGSCDALITDYSSIYFDYTLCNKPIALVWEDYNEYKANPGFAVNVEEFLSGGEKVYSLSDLTSFVENVANGVDPLYHERNVICDRVNISRNGNNSSNVVNFIIEKANL